MSKDIINSLFGLPVPVPETARVQLPRLGLTLTLREISFDKLRACRKEADADLHYFLASVQTPNFRDAAWYKEQMHCATPIDAVKKLLRPGEIERVNRAADRLNGYGPGSVLQLTDREVEAVATAAAMEELEKN